MAQGTDRTCVQTPVKCKTVLCSCQALCSSSLTPVTHSWRFDFYFRNLRIVTFKCARKTPPGTGRLPNPYPILGPWFLIFNKFNNFSLFCLKGLRSFDTLKVRSISTCCSWRHVAELAAGWTSERLNCRLGNRTARERSEREKGMRRNEQKKKVTGQMQLISGVFGDAIGGIEGIGGIARITRPTTIPTTIPPQQFVYQMKNKFCRWSLTFSSAENDRANRPIKRGKRPARVNGRCYRLIHRHLFITVLIQFWVFLILILVLIQY